MYTPDSGGTYPWAALAEGSCPLCPRPCPPPTCHDVTMYS